MSAPLLPSIGDCLAQAERALLQHDEAQLRALRALVDEQAEDTALWFPVGAPGTQLERVQLALRRLHGLIEGEPTPWLEPSP